MSCIISARQFFFNQRLGWDDMLCPFGDCTYIWGFSQLYKWKQISLELRPRHKKCCPQPNKLPAFWKVHPASSETVILSKTSRSSLSAGAALVSQANVWPQTYPCGTSRTCCCYSLGYFASKRSQLLVSVPPTFPHLLRSAFAKHSETRGQGQCNFSGAILVCLQELEPKTDYSVLFRVSLDIPRISCKWPVCHRAWEQLDRDPTQQPMLIAC